MATISVVTAASWLLIAYETRSYGEARGRARHEGFAPEAST